MEVILYQPDIPQNTGNIARTCAACEASLKLVPPLGFALTSRHMKRAGLDYWNEVHWGCIDDLESYLNTINKPFYLFSSHAKKEYTEISYTEDAVLIFGSETKGLPRRLMEKWEEWCVTIPMKAGVRCLNLSNSVAIALYEAKRQNKNV
ncbi:MAG: tRNA (cytidine(34)-2'-O)-methyltransferase [Chlamydiia bacterium]|nr:tRNA (cytidine(34)-2'-O)-methyltransferase [Chlamydiia bacterium]